MTDLEFAEKLQILWTDLGFYWENKTRRNATLEALLELLKAYLKK